MPFSHHSHSGQFCPGHAKDDLESIVRQAISKRMKMLALTEHMPRHDQDRYEEEIDAGMNLEFMFENEAMYFREASRLRIEYQSQIPILIGFESDWCGRRSLELINRSLQMYQYDFFIGSIHHVRGIPIDYTDSDYERAKQACGGTDEQLFEQYFDEQLDMLQALRPPVVGHFDLIRLKSHDFDVSLRQLKSVWVKVLRNLDFISSYGGILEINTAALRKGMQQPYPTAEICQEFIDRGGRFCLSDDSHGTDQVATHYQHVLPFLEAAGIGQISYLVRSQQTGHTGMDVRFSNTAVHDINLERLKRDDFWEISGSVSTGPC